MVKKSNKNKAAAINNLIEKSLLKRFKGICKVNDNIIKTSDRVVPICFIFFKSGEYKPLILPGFKTYSEKEIMRAALLQKLANEDINGYCLIIDCTATVLNKKTKKREVNDAVIRTLYTPKKRISEFIFYKDKKIISKNKTTDKNSFDNWDLWSNGFIMDPIKEEQQNKDHEEFKKNNPEKYKQLPEE